MTRPEAVETEIYYKQGRKKRINYLCYEPRHTAYNNNNNNYNCYINYLDEIGYPKLQIAGFYDHAYQDILSIFISSPLIHNDKKLSGGKSMKLTDVLKIAYFFSQPVRTYLSSINKEKIHDIFSLSNPKVWPIVWQLIYAESLIEVVSSRIHWYCDGKKKMVESLRHKNSAIVVLHSRLSLLFLLFCSRLRPSTIARCHFSSCSFVVGK